VKLLPLVPLEWPELHTFFPPSRDIAWKMSSQLLPALSSISSISWEVVQPLRLQFNALEALGTQPS
jgi:hypothetical protein